MEWQLMELEDTHFFTTPIPKQGHNKIKTKACFSLMLGWGWCRRGYLRIPTLNLPYINPNFLLKGVS